jgi:hypothetical protein
VHEPAGDALRRSRRVAGEGLRVLLSTQLCEADLGHRHRLRVQPAGDHGQPPGRPRHDAVGGAERGQRGELAVHQRRHQDGGHGRRRRHEGEHPGQPRAGLGGGPAEGGLVGQVRRGQHVQAGEHLSGRPRPGLHHRTQARRHPQRALDHRVLDLAGPQRGERHVHARERG